MSKIDMEKPVGLTCEAKSGTCFSPARYIYGPECEAETGKLMYLCAAHGRMISEWKVAHPNDPVECKTHGNIGPVKSYLILKSI